MTRPTLRLSMPLLLSVAAAASIATTTSAAAQATPHTINDLTQGKVHYIASCARCHGVNGDGGEGPPLARAVLPRAPDDASLFRIAANGIPGTAMSDTWWLSAPEMNQLVAYVRSLAPSGPDEAQSLTGDPVRGAALFEDARCTRCHTLGGFGTSRGPDLTTVGARRGATFLREAILDPGAALPRGQTAIAPEFPDYLMVQVVEADGNEVRGARMNEDSYTIQLRDGRGNLHSFYKPDLRTLEKQFDRSLMRSYRDRFTDAEIDDLIAYLASLTGTTVRGVS